MMTPRRFGPRRTAVLAAVGGGLVALAACTSSGAGPSSAAPTAGASAGPPTLGSATTSVPATSRPPASTHDSSPTDGASSGPASANTAPSTHSSSAPTGHATGTPPSINGPGGAGASDSPNGRPSGTAVDAFRAWTADWNGGRYADMYSALPASQQAQVPFRQFAQCQRDQSQQVGASAVVYQRTVRQRRTSMLGRPGTEITASIYFDGFSPVTTQRTLFWYPEGAAWRWALEPGALRSYRHGTCPT